MFDLQLILSESERVETMIANRGGSIDVPAICALNDRRKALQAEFDQLRSEQNTASAEIAQKKKAGEDASEILERMQDIAGRVKALGSEQSTAENALRAALLELPNILAEDTPLGSDESANQEVRTYGTIPNLDFTPVDHAELGEQLGIFEFERATKLSGSRFCVLRNAGARLERALINFMIDVQTLEHGYSETMVPYLVNAETMTGTGQLPKFEADLFKTNSDHYLIPTAEVPLTNLHAGEMLNEGDLPLRFAAFTPCFRSEAGSYGKDTKGLIRQHQFHKVEMVSLSHPEASWDELERMTQCAETILKRLELPYRVMQLCAGDIGFSAAKTYDLEVWLPSQNTYREISSCSNCTDFQARRANIRFKDGNKKKRFVHTLNGSGLAVGRTLIAILENYQQADGSVIIPTALQPYLGGLERIAPATS